MKRAMVVGCILLGGCASGGYGGMTADQIAAIAKVKDASVNCVTTQLLGGKTVVQFVNVDKGVLPPSGGTIKSTDTCEVTITVNPAK